VIDRQEVLSIASELSLAPAVIEKDYVLGWLLAGIYSDPVLGPAWVFKGGTSRTLASCRPSALPRRAGSAST
jgi:predicted nucleotidyltransferase component of viral defense system